MSRYYLQLLLLLVSLPLFSIDLDYTSEPSGITYNNHNNLLYIVGDEGYIYECNMEGELLRKSLIAPLDLEGIVYNSDTSSLFCIDEKSLNLLEVSVKDFKIIDLISLKKVLKGKKRQFESLAYKPSSKSERGTFYIASSIKSTKTGLISSFTLDNKKAVSYKEIPVNLWDISGLSFSNKELHIISDDMDKYAVLNLKTLELTTKSIPGKNQEGVVIVNNEVLILDEIGKIYRQKQ